MPVPTSSATSRRAWLVWGVGVSAYLMAFFHRVTLNVAAGDTAERLGVATGALGLFAFLQLGAYLAMQLPAGFAADRIGPRRTLALGILAIVVGETLFAVAHSLPVAVVGRALVGVGDAVTFVNVLRLVQNWFPERRQALLAALTGMAGGIGQLVATIPLERSLSDFGWTVTFVITIGAAMVVGVLVLVVVRDRPPGMPAPQRERPRARARHARRGLAATDDPPRVLRARRHARAVRRGRHDLGRPLSRAHAGRRQEHRRLDDGGDGADVHRLPAVRRDGRALRSQGARRGPRGARRAAGDRRSSRCWRGPAPSHRGRSSSACWRSSA